jgi:hypothetical protein
MMNNRKLLALFGALVLSAGACADPAASISAGDAQASQDGMLGSGTRTEEDNCAVMGSGNATGTTCPAVTP